VKATIKEIKKLRTDALYGKKKHFNAADRKRKYRLWLNIPVIIINILLGGSLIFTLLKEASPEVAKIGAAIFSFLAAIMVGISIFFNFSKQVEGHNKVGNKYLKVVRGCDHLLALFTDDLIQKEELVERFKQLDEINTEANRDAEAYHTSQQDYKRARRGIKEVGEEEYLEMELER